MPSTAGEFLMRRLDREIRDTGTDADLIDRFHGSGDQIAFELLVRRHGSMVRGICRRELGQDADADDAFQATFLVLARNANSIRRRDALGGWLARVALRAARHLQRRRAQIRGRERGGDFEHPPTMGQEPGTTEVRELIGEEVGKLPEKQRLAVELHYFAGHSTEETARQLGCPRGTVLSRLDAARKQLRRRLGLHGISMSVGGLSALFGGSVEALPATSVRALMGAITAEFGTISEPVTSLVKGVERAMWINKLHVGIAAAVVVTLIGFGLGQTFGDGAEAKKKHRDVSDESYPSRDSGTATISTVPTAAEDNATPSVRLGRPIGTWVRDLAGVYSIKVRITEDRLYGTFEATADGTKLTIELDADYSVNREGMLYGVITGIDIPLDNIAAAEAADEELIGIGRFADTPFCFRHRVDGDSLTIKGLNALGFATNGDDNSRDQLKLINGRYKRVAD